MLNNQAKFLLIVAIAVLLLFLIYNYNSSKSMDQPKPTQMLPAVQPSQAFSGGRLEGFADNYPDAEIPSINNLPQQLDNNTNILPNPYSDKLLAKMNGKNSAKGKYKQSNYTGGDRGTTSTGEWNNYFDTNNDIIGSAMNENKGFVPLDETGNNFAVFNSTGKEKCGGNQNCAPEDLFDVDKYLPQEVKDDWFDVVPEPVSVKNRHLINITKPVGINMIGESNKNSSHDLRGAPNNPKYVVSPWLQSTIEQSSSAFRPLI